jgi:hypothetical protein
MGPTENAMINRQGALSELSRATTKGEISMKLQYRQTAERSHWLVQRKEMPGLTGFVRSVKVSKDMYKTEMGKYPPRDSQIRSTPPPSTADAHTLSASASSSAFLQWAPGMMLLSEFLISGQIRALDKI